MKDNRRAKNLLQKPRQQLKISIFFSSVISVAFCAFVLANLSLLQSSILVLAQDSNFTTSTIDHINRLFAIMTLATLVFALASIGAGFLLGITMTTRMFGPIVPLRRLIASYTDGDYKARSFLRKNDEFHEIMQDLNVLGQTLEERHGPSA